MCSIASSFPEVHSVQPLNTFNKWPETRHEDTPPANDADATADDDAGLQHGHCCGASQAEHTVIYICIYTCSLQVCVYEVHMCLYIYISAYNIYNEMYIYI